MPSFRRAQRFPLLDRANLARIVGLSAGVVTAIQAGTAVVALRKGRRDYADAVWGPGLAAVAVTSAIAGTGDARRRWALAGATTLWAARLERQMLARLRRSDKEDSRYAEFLEGNSTIAVLGKVFLTQALSQIVVSAPIQMAAASALPRGVRRWLAPAGLALMMGGALTEAAADHQKSVYSARPKDQRPDVLDTGLWAWSRHPNYFGDSLVWDGAWLTAAASSPAAWTFPAPAAMTYLLVFATGAKRTEKRMQDRPAYRGYQQRVAFFFPRPPRH